jgi:hypothetical protein
LAELDLATLADITQVLGIVALLGAFAFAIVQIRDFRRQRKEAAAIELVRSFQSPEFIEAVRVVWELPDGLTGEEITARGQAVENAVITVGSVFESLGAMVFHRIVPISVVEDLTGGTLRVTWRKVRPYAEATRREAGFDKPYEWYQWLVERLEEQATKEKDRGAHVRHRDWRP